MKEPPASTGSDSVPPPPEAVSDQPLVERAKAGDLAAYDELIQRHQQRIYGLCYHLTSNHEDANDLAQESFLKAWKALKSFKGDARFYTWLYRVAYNTCLNHLKTRRNRTPHLSLNDLDFNAENDPEMVELVSHNHPRREVGLAELQKGLNAALLRLSEEHRTVVVLHDVQGLAHEEIAKIMNCNPGTVRSRIFYARQQLQAWLSDFRK